MNNCSWASNTDSGLDGGMTGISLGFHCSIDTNVWEHSKITYTVPAGMTILTNCNAVGNSSTGGVGISAGNTYSATWVSTRATGSATITFYVDCNENWQPPNPSWEGEVEGQLSFEE